MKKISKRQRGRIVGHYALGRLSLWAQQAIARGPTPRGAPRFLDYLLERKEKVK